ncbi:hypothetical protein [Streptomyces griseorubiginosus]|uniref:hypothetical protein n=1 Tax=Streptomyces griseorubiginosus TaxID=67304 RepID=UPI002E7FFA2D|nr:hypothetical protein [Streptomyces griseorubiginosus]WUB42652.1 hypothetical protein OHN19_04615 [Streptomyces griseorubiginosus]WUB51171.1 hypothetical protein OG942_04610 [Streptomyces griseorubiginosus]
MTDEDEELGIVFPSAQPEQEHHEFVPQRGLTASDGGKLTPQVCWRVDSLETGGRRMDGDGYFFAPPS